MRKRAAVIGLVLIAAGCAARVPPAPPAVAAPRFPDFVVPAVPQGLGTAALVQRHEGGWQWLQAGDLKAAERTFAAVVKQAPMFYPSEVGLGYVALARKNPKESIQHFDKAVVANPRYAPALAGLSDALLAMGQHKEALQSLEAALQADPSLAALRSRAEVLRFRSQQEEIGGARSLADSSRLDEARAAYLALIESSPQSAFLYRELGDIERRAGNLAAALAHARKAAELEPDDVRTHLLLGDIYEAQTEFASAADALTTAATLQPDDTLRQRVESLRARAAFKAMPAEYKDIATSATVTRAQLAALLAVRLERLLERQRSTGSVVITDTRGSWAAPYILTVSRAGVMEVYPNHTFQPNAVVRRVDLAQAASRVLELIGGADPQAATAWRNARNRKFPDVGPQHFNYRAASVAVEAGVMTTNGEGSFHLTRPVTGAEAVAAVDKLQELGGRLVR